MTLALDLPVTVPPTALRALPSDPPAPAPAMTPPAPAPSLRVVAAPPCAPLYLVADPLPLPEPVRYDDSCWFTEDRTPTAQLPAARPHVGVLVQALVEVFAGARPLTQLRRQLSMELYAVLAARLSGGRRVPGGRPEPRCVLSVHTQERPEGVVEACATVRRRAGRFGTVALRLEGFGDRWVCTEVQGL